MDGKEGESGKDRRKDGDSGVPVGLPWDFIGADEIIARIAAMERGQHVALRANPAILDAHFGIPTSRPIVVRWLERQHILSDRILKRDPTVLVRTLLDPRMIVGNRQGETRRKQPRRRALFYASVDDAYDLAVVVEFRTDGRSHEVVTVFSPTQARTAVGLRSEPVMWKAQ